jgi:hypothetical protein
VPLMHSSPKLRVVRVDVLVAVAVGVSRVAVALVSVAVGVAVEVAVGVRSASRSPAVRRAGLVAKSQIRCSPASWDSPAVARPVAVRRTR